MNGNCLVDEGFPGRLDVFACLDVAILLGVVGTAPAQPGMEEGVETDRRAQPRRGDEGVHLVDEEREQQEAREERGPRPQDEDALPEPVAEAQQAVVDVVLVRRVEALPRAVRRTKAKAMSTSGTPRMKSGMNRGAKKK